MIAKGNKSTPYIDLGNISDFDIVAFYFHVSAIPCLMNSPLRQDRHPSFVLYSYNSSQIYYKDFSTKESGSLFSLLKKLWSCNTITALKRIKQDLSYVNSNSNVINTSQYSKRAIRRTNTSLKVKIRGWQEHDLQYWKSYGISLEWLKYADIYPISHKIIVKDQIKYVYKADEYAYAYVERKENKVTLKVYQPFNKHGFKWSNKHDKSVISLWTKIPKSGNTLCICSSMKDALCLWANTGIPSLAVQGEGYNISKTALDNLKNRYCNIFVCFDNDKAGLEDGTKFSEATGFTNIVLPFFKEGKDISDLYKSLNNIEKFKEIMISLFKNKLKNLKQ